MHAGSIDQTSCVHMYVSVCISVCLTHTQHVNVLLPVNACLLRPICRHTYWHESVEEMPLDLQRLIKTHTNVSYQDHEY